MGLGHRGAKHCPRMTSSIIKTEMTQTNQAPSSRTKRFSKPLKSTGISVKIPDSWDCLPILPEQSHDEAFVKILRKHKLPVSSPVPMVGRYSKARRWSAEELRACVEAHDKGVPVALMSAALNRNPQDIIFRLLDECHDSPKGFREVGLKNSKKWTESTLAAGRELFEAGLTAWRIAALFGMDFEGAEKILYQGRKDYGHTKKNPFAICTDHKQVVNRIITARLPKVARALEAFAGEGRFAKTIVDLHPKTELICVEIDEGTIEKGRAAHDWSSNVSWRHSDNLCVLHELAASGYKFQLVDLDPFVSCRDQVEVVWPLIEDGTALYVTFGGEYRRSFIGTNRKAIQRRYGWINEKLSNSEYLEVIPEYFYGWLASQAASNGYTLNLEYCVRYPNNCRFWTIAKRASPEACAEWLSQNTIASEGGIRWHTLQIPRFSEVRNRVSELEQGIPLQEQLASNAPKRNSKTTQLEFAL